MKTKIVKRLEAESRAMSYTWGNSKAKRLGKVEQSAWESKQVRK
jgi:hypothetical protein